MDLQWRWKKIACGWFCLLVIGFANCCSGFLGSSVFFLAELSCGVMVKEGCGG
ncbi:hypothetical protein HanRHA438_Chr01g0031841 [Helianthus annuus]|nr:hypothetical protein HanRHA438_Chr01g0031841 [Helianthus annuus]